MKIRKSVFGLLLFNVMSMSYAGTVNNAKVSKLTVYSGGYARFTLTQTPPATCNFYGYQFRFDVTTEGGKQLLNSLRIAKLTEQSINVAYRDSTVIGKDQSNGCTDATMAVAVAVATL